MKKMSEPVTFFGSGPVAAEALSRLAEDFDIEAVITKPKPPHHKYAFPVIEVAEKLGLKIYEVSTKHELDELFLNHPVTSRLGIVIDYGIIISEEVINYFPLGIVNSHFSLLPKYRGADPISFAILSGDKQTGISLMLIVPALDEGPLLAQRTLDIKPKGATVDLTKDLINLSHDVLVEILPKYVNGDIKPYPQDTNGVSYSKKLTKADSILDWHKTAEALEREIRAYIEWPRSRTNINGTNVVITAAHALEGQGMVGKIYLDGHQLGFYTSKGILVIETLIPEGKKEMSASAFLAGHPI